MSLRLICLFILSLQVFVTKQNPQESLCQAQQSCSDCLQAPDCVWCREKTNSNSKGPFVRCVTRDYWKDVKEEWCPQSKVLNLESTNETLENESFSTDNGKDTIQVEPQKLRLRLRKGDTKRLVLRYRQAEDYPVDLYYLMDLSSSMQYQRNSLSELSSSLIKAMKNLTTNFRIGFGSFVDKVVMPMTSTEPDKLVSPCVLNDTDQTPCKPPYSYKNQLPLTENSSLFKEGVLNAPISGNIDSPEGGLDALMQVMVCTKEIGWRPKARHLIIYSSDADFHIAGDGRLAGIIEPNDCLCHLDEKGFYSHELLQDYPSISQVKRKADEYNMNIIFAVPEIEFKIYENLSKRINGSSVGALHGDSENVVNLVTEEYKRLRSSVELKDNAPKFIEVKYFSKCTNASDDLKQQQVCSGLHGRGDTVEFEIDVKVPTKFCAKRFLYNKVMNWINGKADFRRRLESGCMREDECDHFTTAVESPISRALECPENSEDWKRTLEIKPQGVNESLTIELELLCQCDCEKPEDKDYIRNADVCNKRGDLTCGICSCDSTSTGKHCECLNGAGAQGSAGTEDCKPANETLVCSGQGHCRCGICQCSKRSDASEWYSGKYCQCDNFSCQRHKGYVCGGRDRGTCECGTCNCKSGWGGKDCGCKNTNTTCTPPGDNSKICNDRGKCVCGACECEKKNGIQYYGQYCEECPTCSENLCSELKDCVECIAWRLGPQIADECRNCSYSVVTVDKVEPSTDATICTPYGDAGCSFRFKYYTVKGRGDNPIVTVEIEVEKERECPRTVNVIGVAGGLIAGTVFLGFLSLVIWKLLTMAHDQREFAKFERERAIAKWDRGDNPLYKKATSQFENPTFTHNEKSS